MDYVIEYSDLKTRSFEYLLNQINSIEGISLSQIKISDLSFRNGIEIYPGNGVYIFRENKFPKYIGKCSSTSFTERISKHFDFRTGAWFNSLAKNVCVKDWQIEINDENLKKAVRHCFDNYNLILIHFNLDYQYIAKLERLLLFTIDSLNSYKNKWGNEDMSEILWDKLNK